MRLDEADDWYRQATATLAWTIYNDQRTLYVHGRRMDRAV